MIILTLAIVLCNENLDYLFLNIAEIPIITPAAIIPVMPIVSFDWNKNAEPKKTAADKMLPESIALFFFVVCFCISLFSSMNFFISGAIVIVSSIVFAKRENDLLISSIYASLISDSSSRICRKTLINLKSTLCVW